MQEETLVIDTIAPKEKPVKIGGQDYVIVEANGRASAEHRNLIMDNAVWKDGQIQSIRQIASAEIKLLSHTLLKCETDEAGLPIRTPVPAEVIGSWPGKVITKLFEAAKKLSGLDETPKNQESSSGQSGSTDG